MPPQFLKGNIMYYFKLVLVLCGCIVLAFSGATIMYHMPNIIGLSAGLFFIGVGLYLFDWVEREHQHENLFNPDAEYDKMTRKELYDLIYKKREKIDDLKAEIYEKLSK